ncbi:hypothetical protein TNCV_665601 [Trichonephila clavipes]|uniref:Uncharacterized protein n=1 Tax=Trichonephila clavipes TaxID=2585209 RepID=A0A8X6VHK0_TRICX|nr:hypothetical protein TNCV_665601 [Trichonephila clavipes]
MHTEQSGHSRLMLYDSLWSPLSHGKGKKQLLKALAEHSGTAFTPRVTLPREYSLYVLHPFRPEAPHRHDEAASRTQVIS